MDIAFQLLKWVRNIYITLHQDSDSAPTQFSSSTDDEDVLLHQPSSYPLCNVANHHPDSTPHIHDDPAPTTSGNAVLVPAPPTSPEAHSFSVPLLVVESRADEPSLDNFHPAHQTIIESPRTPTISPDPSTASAIHVIENSSITTPLTTPGTSASAPPFSHTSPPAAVSLQHKSDLLTPSDPPDLPSSVSNPVPDKILPICPPMPLHLPMTPSDLLPSCSESHRLPEVTTTPSAPPGPTSAPDLDAAAEDDGNPIPGSRKETDALDPRSMFLVFDIAIWYHSTLFSYSDDILSYYTIQITVAKDADEIGEPPKIRKNIQVLFREELEAYYEQEPERKDPPTSL
ncbi:hypothetical protein EDB83DRAFT_2553800 [Lactarius deliciosus]|nr:hypothetical protein EDB83DRAFT_2553800 [Lactarius deliciosus]